ncbi:uncharacterized protein LOC134261374, partial [Saccostrea cucullata]|uniref:uncharacterized protein LOC134261374 n=1 Tax=Saccostrea cuccullata TaxID=36930 RepID=UPI002ED1E01E
MADINALSQISERVRIHRKLENSLASTADFLTFSKEVSDETRGSANCIKGVAEYARKINGDLVKLKELIKEFEIQIGEKMKKLCDSGFVVGLTSTTDATYTRPLQ